MKSLHSIALGLMFLDGQIGPALARELAEPAPTPAAPPERCRSPRCGEPQPPLPAARCA